jgi:hypothetical protein
MKAGNPLRGCIDVPVGEAPPRKKAQGIATPGQSSHDHAVLRSVREDATSRFEEWSDHESRGAFFDRCHPQVNVRSQPPVQLDFADAVRIAFGTSREVHEAEVDCLPDLVDAVARQKHVGQMGLHVLDP